MKSSTGITEAAKPIIQQLKGLTPRLHSPAPLSTSGYPCRLPAALRGWRIKNTLSPFHWRSNVGRGTDPWRVGTRGVAEPASWLSRAGREEGCRARSPRSSHGVPTATGETGTIPRVLQTRKQTHRAQDVTKVTRQGSDLRASRAACTVSTGHCSWLRRLQSGRGVVCRPAPAHQGHSGPLCSEARARAPSARAACQRLTEEVGAACPQVRKPLLGGFLEEPTLAQHVCPTSFPAEWAAHTLVWVLAARLRPQPWYL